MRRMVAPLTVVVVMEFGRLQSDLLCRRLVGFGGGNNTSSIVADESKEAALWKSSSEGFRGCVRPSVTDSMGVSR
jgi:hypothetical protein